MKKVKVKVKDLHGKALAWALSVFESMADAGCARDEAEMWAEGIGLGFFGLEELVEKYKVGILPPDGHRGSQWMAFFYQRTNHDLTMSEGIQDAQFANTPLIAVIRCILAHHVGKEVEVPEELL